MLRKILPALAAVVLLLTTPSIVSQASDDAIQVTVTMNPDGSKTVYKMDSANHRCVATTTSANGKPRGKIIYRLDEEGRYESGLIFTGSGAFRFKASYRYNAAGRLAQETQLAKDGSVLHKIVYSFDPAGHPSGYAIYDGDGNLLGRTTPKVSGTRRSSGR
jgi:YD repeat-containing protein